MDAPITAEELLALASRYNALIEPLQILIYIPTLLIFYLLRRGTKQDTSRGVLLLLAAEWAMVGVLFFLNVMAEHSWLGYVGGGFFIGAALLYAVGASRSFPPHFRWRGDNPTLLSVAVIVIGIIGYPLLSWLADRQFPAVTTYGLMPGAVVMLTLGVVMAARPGPRLWLMIPPLIYVLLTPLMLYWWGLWEDLVLLPCGVMAVLAWVLWRGKNTEAPTKDTIRFDF
jgi:drug/metabolite transporter superfamily protein YnfA